MWINRHKLNNSLAVLIHGITGNRFSTWAPFLDVLQAQALEDGLIRSWDTYTFDYATGFVCQPSLQEHAIPGLRRFLRAHQSHYETIALIAHSQGGLVAKLFVIEELLAGRGAALDVDLVVTFGTPHFGYARLSFGALPLHAMLSRLPGAKKEHRLRQWRDLHRWSPAFKTLARQWPGVFDHPDRRRRLRSIAVRGNYDQIVRSRRSMGLPGDTVEQTRSGHRLQHEQAKILFRQLRDHLAPREVIHECRRLQVASVEEVRNYITAHFAPVSKAVSAARPGAPASFVQAKAGTLLMDFVFDFEQRPMRGLGFGEAVLEFARRSLAGESP